MRTVYLRCLNGLIVLWGIVACLLVSGGRDLLADPGDCDKECRMVDTFGSTDFTKTFCARYKYKDCSECTYSGCNNNVAKLDGTCQEDTTTPWECDTTITCSIVCNTVTKNRRYEATTKATDFNYTKSDTLFVNKCLPKTGGGGVE